MNRMHNPPHPGEILKDWLEDYTVTDAATRLGVSRVTLSRVLNGAAGISADMDLRLSMALGTTPGLWLRLQADRDLSEARKSFRGKVRKIPVSISRLAPA